MIYVVPTLAATFKSMGAELPAATKAVIATSDFMSSHVIMLFAILALSILAIIAFFRSKIGGTLLLAFALGLPVSGKLVRETFSARAARALSSLLSSGVEMLSAISITAEVVGDNRFGKIVVEAEARVKKGDPLSAAFTEHTKLYPIFIGEMITVG